MQPHERIRIQPVTAGTIATVDEHDMSVGLGHHGVGEGQPGDAGTHDQIVGLDLPHRRSGVDDTELLHEAHEVGLAPVFDRLAVA